MNKISILILTLVSISAHANVLQDFHTKGCELTGSYSKWHIVSKLSEGQYDVSIEQGPYRPPQKAIINIKSLEFSRTGEIGPYIFLIKDSVKKMKTKDGFDVDVTIYNESLECKEFYLRKIQFLQGAYPNSPELDQKIWNEDQERLKKKREERKKAKQIQQKEELKKVSKDKAIQDKKRKKRESLYE